MGDNDNPERDPRLDIAKKPHMWANPRRQKLLASIMTGRTVEQASVDAGYPNPEAAHKVLRNVRAELQESFAKYGLTPDTFVRDYLLPLMNATETKFFTFKGEVTDSREVESLPIRLDSMKAFARLAGYMPKKDEEGPGKISITINNVVCDETE